MGQGRDSEQVERKGRKAPRRLHATLLVMAQVSIVVVGSVAVVTESHAEETCPIEQPLARSILDCVEPAMAFVQTPLSRGTGLLLADGMVVTNAHVVDPYGAADITVGGATHEDVPLVGVDLLADVALLGPVETDVEPVVLEPTTETIVGEDVFLVGYPGETDDDPTPAVSQGVLSRTRDLDRWELSYLQTDASIGRGQSGGALVGGSGQVIGLSTLRFADDFALALTVDEVQESLGRIRSGDGHGYTPWPAEGSGHDQFRLAYSGDDGFARVVVPPSPDARTVELTITGAPVFLIASDHFGMTVGVSPSYISLAEEVAAHEGIPIDEMLAPGERHPGIVSEDPGGRTLRVEVPADAPVHLAFIPALFGPGSLDTTVASNVPLGQGTPPQSTPIEVGGSVDGVIDTYGWPGVYTVALTEGQTVEFYAGAPVADMLLGVRAPSQPWPEATFVDDSDEGLYGTDATLTYTAPETGVYDVEVGTLGPHATGYQLTVSSPA